MFTVDGGMGGTEFRVLVDAATVARRLGDESWVVVDCRFDLADVEAGRSAYLEAHVPGAVYAHLDRDLSGPPLTDHGRHPLPSTKALAETFRRFGIGAGTQVVAYDHADGSIAARLWWLLRYVGHDRVAVLDGGFRAWRDAGHPVLGGEERRAPAPFESRVRAEWLVTVDAVPQASRLVDARAPARYRGETEPLDPVAGHVPGAVNHFFRSNVDEEGRFLAPETVRAGLDDVLRGCAPEAAVHYCGSGVTACHNLLAAAYAGLAPGRLYAGSWSDWCSDPARPIATGADP